MTRKGISNTLAIFGLLLVLAVSFGDSLAYGHSLSIKVEGLRNEKGVVHLLLYDDAIAFEENSLSHIAHYSAAPVSGAEVVVTVTGVTPGTYAAVLHHDENENNVFDMVDAIPIEGYAYSNAVGRVAVPTFDQAAFRFGGEDAAATIEMIYVD
ncbi:MAG: DUF2141 domain-containing protein [Pseudomonadota bacterium]